MTRRTRSKLIRGHAPPSVPSGFGPTIRGCLGSLGIMRSTVGESQGDAESDSPCQRRPGHSIMGGQSGTPLFDRNFLHLKARNAMHAKTVRIDLRYDRDELKQILRYAGAHDVRRNGRYDFRMPPHLNIWTHAWSNDGCKAESCVMFRLTFDWKTASLMSVLLLPGFDWEAFVDELVRLEMAALGKSDGRCRREPTT